MALRKLHIHPLMREVLFDNYEEKCRTDPVFRQHADEAKPLLKELEGVGLEVVDLWEFVNTRDAYPEAIPLLIRHLELPYHWGNKEAIVRALCVKEAKGLANEALWREFQKVDKKSESDCFAFANTLDKLLTLEEIDKVVAVLHDEEYGPHRSTFIKMLARWRRPEKRALVLKKAEDILIKLCHDPHPITRKAARFTWHKLCPDRPLPPPPAGTSPLSQAEDLPPKKEVPYPQSMHLLDPFPTHPITGAPLRRLRLKKFDHFYEVEWREEALTHPRFAAQREEQKSLLAELRDVGLEVEDVMDFVDTVEPYPEAIPVLLRHLERPYNDRNKYAIISALGVREAQGIVNEALWREFDKLDKEDDRRDDFCHSLRKVLTIEEIDKVIEVLREKNWVALHISFMKFFKKWRSPKKCALILEKAGDILKERCEDPHPFVREAARSTWEFLHRGLPSPPETNLELNQ